MERKGILFDEQDGTSGFFLIPKSKLYSGKSKFQKIEIFEHGLFGKILRIDNRFQSSELDEFLYHEPLVHFPLFSHGCAKKVLIIGGGSGYALREVIKYKDIDEINLVELDKKVVDISKKFLYNVNKNSFDDSRIKIFYKDGMDYLKKTNKRFDVIILDLTDPSGESLKLYTKEFYNLLKKTLNERGIVSLHVESCLFYPKIFGRIIETLKSIFKYVSAYNSDIPLYGGIFSFAICSDMVNFNNLELSKLKEQFNKKDICDLKYFTPSLFLASLDVPKYVKDILSEDNEIITLQNPLNEGTGGNWEEKW